MGARDLILLEEAEMEDDGVIEIKNSKGKIDLYKSGTKVGSQG